METLERGRGREKEYLRMGVKEKRGPWWGEWLGLGEKRRRGA